MRKLLATLSLVAWAGVSWAAGVSNGPPSQQLVQVGVDGHWKVYSQVCMCIPETMDYAYTVKVPVTVQKEQTVNGKAETYTVTEYKQESRTATRTVVKTVCKQVVQEVDPKELKAFETSGKPITAADLAKRIKDDTLVVVSPGEGMIAPYYASVFKPGTIIVSFPPPPAPTVPQQASTRSVSYQQPGEEGPALLRSPPARLPTTLPPMIVFASRDGADNLKLRHFNEHEFETEVTVRTGDSSVAVEKQLKLPQSVRTSNTISLPLQVLRVSNPDSGDLPLDRVKERLGTGESSVLVSADGSRVDEFWLQNIQSKVFVLRGVKLNSLGGCGPVGYAAPVMAAPPAPAEGQILPAPPPPSEQPAPAPAPVPQT